MSDAFSAGRRRFLRLAAALPALFAGAPFLLGRPLAQTDPGDRGIGGTGARPSEEEGPGGDRGIGGTGVIGTIRRFGSIVVNDLRIAYPRDVSVRIDGMPARAADLKVGHVVRVVAQGPEGGLATRAIEVMHEVVGPVEAVEKGRLTVLGQRVTTAGAGNRAWTVGERVAVSGLRRGDGTIVASLIEPRGEGPARVSGPVRKGADGVPTIGSLRLEGLRAGLVGRRAVVEGTPGGTGLAVTGARDASRPFAAGVAQVSIEGYVVREGGALRFGSGLSAAGTGLAANPGGARAVVTGGLGRDGRIAAQAVRVEGRDGGPGGPGGGRGGPGGGSGGGAGGGPGHAPGQTPGSRPGRDGLSPGRGGYGPGREGAQPRGYGGGEGLRIDTRPAPGNGPGGGFGGQSGPGGGPPSGFGGPGPGFGGSPGFGGPPGGAPPMGPGGPGPGGGFGGGGFGGGGGGFGGGGGR